MKAFVFGMLTSLSILLSAEGLARLFVWWKKRPPYLEFCPVTSDGRHCDHWYPDPFFPSRNCCACRSRPKR